jgi:hypothetical protein
MVGLIVVFPDKETEEVLVDPPLFVKFVPVHDPVPLFHLNVVESPGAMVSLSAVILTPPPL